MANATLDAVMQRIQQKWGQQAIQSGRMFHPAFASLQTGFKALDQTSGGVPRGHISVWSGVPTCGMSTHIPREENSLADALAGEASSGRRWCTFPQYWER